MNVQLIEVLGTDLTVVNAARVSFAKHHENFEDQDERLIRYLALHGHWTPFGHPQLQFRISAPIFVARQLVKHQVGLVWNETSRRYVDTDPMFWLPVEWRERASDKKQGSGTKNVRLSQRDLGRVEQSQLYALETYKMLLSRGVAPEQARILLPQSMYTEWYWTGSLYAFSRVCRLRLAPDAQEETKNIAKQIYRHASEAFPISWKYLMAHE